MRSSFVLSLTPALCLTLIACDDRPLTGPDARAAYAKASAGLQGVPEGPIVFVDGRRVPPGSPLDGLDPRAIARIEIVKGGDSARAGVVRIYTVPGSRRDPTRSR